MTSSTGALAATVASAAVLFSDDFESGGTTVWRGTDQTGIASSTQVTTLAAMSGAFGLDTLKAGVKDNGAAQVWAALTAPTSRVLSLRARLRIVSRQGSGALYLQRLYRRAPLYKAVVAVHHSGSAYALELRRVDGSTVLTPMKTQLALGTWYDLELVYDWSGTQPGARLFVDGALDAEATDTSTGSVYAPDSAYVGVWEDGWTQQADANWDDVSVADGVQSLSIATADSTPATPVITSTTLSKTAVPAATSTSAATATPPTPVPTRTGTATSGSAVDEWSQDGHDAQHTGATNPEPAESWTFAWAWNGPDARGGTSGHFYDAPREARTVSGGGRIYVPAGAQGLYALDQGDGSVAWHLAGHVFNASPAYDPTTGAVFAGSADGSLYKVNATTGQVQATYAAGAPLNKAVLLVGGFVYLVNTNGELHKVDAAALARQWVYRACAAQCALDTPPAYSSSRDLLVFATGDLYVHGVNNSDGTARWRVKPTPHQPVAPYTFDFGWPVIAEKHGLALVRMQLGVSELGAYPSINSIFPNTNSAVRDWLHANPDQQNLFALSLDNGTAPFVPAVGYGSVDVWVNGAFSTSALHSMPVVKVWPNGDEVVYIQFRNGQSSPLDYRWDAHMGEMVLDGSTVPGLEPGDLRFVKMSRYRDSTTGYSEGGNAYTFISDEESPISMAGGSLFFSHWGSTDSVRLTDRSSSRGLTYTSPIASTNHPSIIRQLRACQDYQPSTHWTTCGLELYNDGRYWDGPGFWEYWNSLDPTGLIQGIGQTPRYTYVSSGLIVVEGNGGDLMVLRHAGSSSNSSMTPAATPTATATPTAVAPSTPTPAPTPSGTPTPDDTGGGGSGVLRIGPVGSSGGSVAAYDKLELSFAVTTAATNPQLPYDPAPPTGLAARIGVSVDAELLPPGQTDWGNALVQSAFLYQDYQRQLIGAQQWLYPQSTPTWKVRFAPQQPGSWQVRIRAQDASICGAGVNPCTNWVRSGAFTFGVSAPRAGNHGFLHVSPTDSRYFTFSDGTPFSGQGFNDSLSNTYEAETKLAADGAAGVNLLRVWMSGQGIVGSAWSPWVAFNAPNYGGYLPETGLQNAPPGSGRDFVLDLSMANNRPCIFDGLTQGQIGVKPNTTYRVSTTVLVQGVTPAAQGFPSGFAVKTGLWPTDNSCPAGITATATPIGATADTNGWTTLSGTLTTDGTQQFLGNLYLVLDNAATGEALISQVSLREVVAGGGLGPELLAKGSSDMHLDFSQPASWSWDYAIDQAAQKGVYLKLVVLEKNDRIWNRINLDGSVGTNDTANDNFYAAANTKVRRLHEYYWRYLAARWGYATAVHSWELLNEGDPYNGNHYGQADAFAKFIHGADPARHMATTSTWGSFPAAEFWGNPAYPNIDYADLHAYISTGLGNFEWSPPAGMALETDPAETFGASQGALRQDAGIRSSAKSIAIRGQGDWQVSVWIRARGIQGSCPYGAPASLAGPRLQVSISGVTTRSIPYNPALPDQFFICTSPAGTYDYTQFNGTIAIPDAAWHTLTLTFLSDFATSGTAWFDDLVVRGPDGRSARLFGSGDFDDRARMDYDSALFTQVFSLLDGARSLSGGGKPLVRGETGIDHAGGPQTELLQLADDTHGVWLHNLLWGGLNPGGMLDLYWWNQNIVQNRLLFQYSPVRDFLAGIPLANGLYQDAEAMASDSNVAAIGQKDLVHGRAHLWIRNLNHTWWNVVNKVGWGSLRGSVSVSGFSPNASRTVEWWAFDDTGTLIRSASTEVADSSGVLRLNLAPLPNTTTDVAIKIT
jgi:hypothetical protein